MAVNVVTSIMGKPILWVEGGRESWVRKVVGGYNSALHCVS